MSAGISVVNVGLTYLRDRRVTQALVGCNLEVLRAVAGRR